MSYRYTLIRIRLNVNIMLDQKVRPKKNFVAFVVILLQSNIKPVMYQCIQHSAFWALKPSIRFTRKIRKSYKLKQRKALDLTHHFSQAGQSAQVRGASANGGYSQKHT